MASGRTDKMLEKVASLEQALENNDEKVETKIKVFDRFTMILQIFSKRAKTHIAKLQIEICYLNYL